MSKATKMIGEIIDHFTVGIETPGDDWAAADDKSCFGLDYMSSGGTKFWIDLDREDGSVSLMWKPEGETRPEVLIFYNEEKLDS